MFMKEKVLIDDLETSDENIFVDVRHKGIPFTGTAYDETEHLRSEYVYANGFGHGRSFSVYKNGRLCEEFFLEHGETIEETYWHQSGVKKKYFRGSPFLYQVWNQDGDLIIEDNDDIKKEWHPSGKLKSEFFKKKEKIYYGEDGNWALKIKTQDGYAVLDKKEMIFNELYLNEHYMALLQDHDFYPYFIIWLADLNEDKREEIVCTMINSDVLWHKYCGINLASLTYKIHQAVPYIKHELNNNQIPPTIRDVEGFGSSGFGHTIAQRAGVALKELKKHGGIF
jgi:antitoxin component YwqK of YwqJK toxin-antitoxin module